MKILYAFIWQEFFIKATFLYNPVGLRLGAGFLPLWNEVADRIGGFHNPDSNVRLSKDVYPGDSYCRTWSPHSLWHEQSANGLLELIYFGDYVNYVIKQSMYGNPQDFEETS